MIFMCSRQSAAAANDSACLYSAKKRQTAAPHTIRPDSHRIEKRAAVRRFAQSDSVFDQFCLFQRHYEQRYEDYMQYYAGYRLRERPRPEGGKAEF